MPALARRLKELVSFAFCGSGFAVGIATAHTGEYELEECSLFRNRRDSDVDGSYGGESGQNDFGRGRGIHPADYASDDTDPVRDSAEFISVLYRVSQIGAVKGCHKSIAYGQ
jgi:hypothetical protein